MSVASEITRLQTAKADLKTAIEGKGVTVPSSAKLDAYPALVESIQQGGSVDEDNWYLISSAFDNAYVFRRHEAGDSWIMTRPDSIYLQQSNAGLYFMHNGEKYYATDIKYGNNPLSKTGQPVDTPTAIDSFDGASISKDAVSGNFIAHFSED